MKFEPVPETLELTVADAAKVAALLAAGTLCQWQAAPAGGSVTGPHARAPPRPPVLAASEEDPEVRISVCWVRRSARAP